VKATVWLPVAEAAVTVTVTLPSTVLVNVVDALPLASVVELDSDRVPEPEATAKLTSVPATTVPPVVFTTLAVMVTELPAK
jgi:hypothetical protein